MVDRLFQASKFWPEWLFVAALIAVDFFWAKKIGFHLKNIHLALIPILVQFYFCTLFRLIFRLKKKEWLRKLALFFEFWALLMAGGISFLIFIYLCYRTDRPLGDAYLLKIDRAMGFNWGEWVQYTGRVYRSVQDLFRKIYFALGFEPFLAAIVFIVLGQIARMREFFWLTAFSLLLTGIIGSYMPAIGPALNYGLFRNPAWVMEHLTLLRDLHMLQVGKDLTFSLNQMTGLVTFPSYHTTGAIVFAYAFRGTGLIGKFILILNLLMLPAIPFFGDHYLIDMIAGAGVAFLCIGLVRYAPWAFARMSALKKNAAGAAALGNRISLNSIMERRPKENRTAFLRIAV